MAPLISQFAFPVELAELLLWFAFVFSLVEIRQESQLSSFSLVLFSFGVSEQVLYLAPLSLFAEMLSEAQSALLISLCSLLVQITELLLLIGHFLFLAKFVTIWRCDSAVGRSSVLRSAPPFVAAENAVESDCQFALPLLSVEKTQLF